MTKHLYVHIPFCKQICPYCDFKKTIYNQDLANKYIDLVCHKIDQDYKNIKFSTIYVGGGTPNCLLDLQIQRLLNCLSKHLANKYEFTIEINPELLTKKQANIFFLNHVNRVSIGIQTLKKHILQSIKRLSYYNLVKNTIQILLNNKIENISCDLIYGFQNQTNNDIKDDIAFLIKNHVKHLSMYSLEIKPNTLWGKQHYTIDELAIENNLKFIISYLQKHHFTRYEVSNWAINDVYQSQHNIGIWQTHDWTAIGYGAHGMENKCLYYYDGSILDWQLIKKKQTQKDFYYQILMMGLRLAKGIDLTIKNNYLAYQYFKKKLVTSNLVKIVNNYLFCTNLNLLDNLLVDLL